MMLDKSHTEGAPRQKVELMFDSIARHYDRLNHILSLGTDRHWRRRAVNLIASNIRPERILDVATGTGDLAIEAMRLGSVRVTGIDISEKMLDVGRKKIMRMGHGDTIELLRGDASSMVFGDSSFDVAMSAFGVRNFEDRVAGLTEMCRVLRPGGMVMVLEFSRPTLFPLKQIYGLYFRRVLPRIGRKVSGDPEPIHTSMSQLCHFPITNCSWICLYGQVLPMPGREDSQGE